IVSTYAVTYTLSLHDALPICGAAFSWRAIPGFCRACTAIRRSKSSSSTWQADPPPRGAVENGSASHFRNHTAPVLPDPQQLRPRSEEHMSELQSRENLVCRLL